MEETARVLLGSLDAQRAHVVGILDGLDAHALCTPVLPSGWSCLGLVQHLAIDVERFWFREVVAGEQAAKAGTPTEGCGSAWDVDAATTPESVFASYAREVQRANAVIASTPLDTAPRAWPQEQFGDSWLPDLRAVMVHVLTETACHAGHLDAARELIDGRTWLTL